MEPIATMDRANAQRIRDILDKALPEVLAPYGLSFQLGNARYDDDSVKFTGFNIAVAGGLTQMEKDLAGRVEMSAEYGVELDADKVATYRGEEYALVGFKPRNRKYPYIWKKLSNGSNWKFDVETTERFFGKDTGGAA